MAKSTKFEEIEMNDIVHVSKIPVLSYSCPNQTSPVGVKSQASKDLSRGFEEKMDNTSRSEQMLNTPIQTLAGSDLTSTDTTEKVTPLIRLGSLSFMDRIKKIEDEWLFREAFSRRYVPSNESCPKGGHSKIDIDRYCDFKEFPSTPTDRRTFGSRKQRRVVVADKMSEGKTEVSKESAEQGRENTQSDVDKNSIGDCISTSSITKGKKKKIIYGPKAGKNDKKLTKAKEDTQKTRENTKQSKQKELSHGQYFTMIFEQDGSIRYADDGEITSATESSEDDRKIVNDAACKKEEPAKKTVLRKKKRISSTAKKVNNKNKDKK